MKNIKSVFLSLIGCLLLSFTSVNVHSQMMETKMVGGAEMYPSKNIVENAVNSADHTTLVAALKAADLVSTLEGKGPFTVFAPTNEAFNELPEGTVQNLLKADNKSTLRNILTYHVVSGKYNSDDLEKMINENNGKAPLKSVQGEDLWVMKNDEVFWIMDKKGNKAKITIPDVYQSNGVIHVINKVLMP